jgi:hypothetical protein
MLGVSRGTMMVLLDIRCRSLGRFTFSVDDSALRDGPCSSDSLFEFDDILGLGDPRNSASVTLWLR